MCLAVPGEVLTIVEGATPLERAGRVRFGDVVRDVNLACTPEARVGDFVVVHVGLALSVLDPADVQQTLEDLRVLTRPA